ncbi:TetR/AcrR family transcriptional regulator [Nocardia stercoris]|uniref:TetR/AcrR family transcriptional regulator n=1 Tax=Nocardia stercoris TaxID=2483361 RepID=UPI001319CDEE|nr:TetR family transcriptional regulator C-terminal domain-containing protein [Nocardia stercoris]
MTERRHRPSAQARRAALLRATVEVAAAEGVAGITHRAVTERAGLPLATVSYFFDSIGALIEEALRDSVAADAAVQEELAEALAEAHSSPEEVVAAFTPAVAPRFPDTLAMLEAYLHAARHPEFRDAVADALAMSRQVSAAAVRAAGAPDPEAVAPAFAAVAHGFALHELAVPGSVPPEYFDSAFRALFLGFLLDAGHVDLAMELRRQPAPEA